ncbi:hypothetical protein RchiOBHm_Chr6g0280231 [Rosa chinensis]|uniref:LysM domain-containing protein n=1 Tax=Rosa chinensis TaxID=74649 RepID=A0A2P6PT67_ROSCH|nr:hypothetical protein RchiOBHm_Chr6g0280231 [Rosa chinensis]
MHNWKVRVFFLPLSFASYSAFSLRSARLTLIEWLTLLLTLLISTLTAPSSAATFNCTTPSANSTCQSLIDFAPTNATTLNAVKTLFNITHLRTLLGANNLPLSTRTDEPVTANRKLRIPFSCRCFNGSSVSYRRPQYIVKAGVSGIPDPNKIEVGQKLWIPLPCSCDKVDG